jgi:thiamine kinase-like enzyme
VASKKIHKIKKEFLKLQGGSGASIFQITSGRGNVNLIKKSSGTSSEKLKEQFNFIEENKDKLKFPKILNSNSLSNYYFSYTMEKIEGSRELTKLVAELPTNKSKKLIKKILNKLEKFVYKNYKIEDIESDYIKKRFKLKIIEVDNLIRKSEFSEILETKFSINREECLSYSECVETLLKNLEFLDKGPRLKVSHGDLTFSNIMVSKDMELVFLDPNPSDNFNFLSSEIGKMYQSSDGMYETLASLNVKVSRKNDRKIGLKYSTLRAYKNKKISNFLSSYVVEKYGDEVLYSAKFYNLMHFFRLLPYKLKYEKHNFLKYFYVFLLLVTKESRKFTERSAETQRMETP